VPYNKKTIRWRSKMSQEKVDQYKKEKANRKKNIARQKRQNVMYKVFAAILGMVVVAWIVLSVLWTKGIVSNPFVVTTTTETTTLSEAELSSMYAVISEAGLLDEDDTTESDETTTALDDTTATETETTEEETTAE